MDQAELDAAYDQSVYAPNLQQIVRRYATNSEAVRARLGAPRRYAYGPTPIEGLDLYTTKRPDAPINVFIHGGAWRAGLAKDNAFPAELFVHAGAHYGSRADEPRPRVTLVPPSLALQGTRFKRRPPELRRWDTWGRTG